MKIRDIILGMSRMERGEPFTLVFANQLPQNRFDFFGDPIPPEKPNTSEPAKEPLIDREIAVIHIVGFLIFGIIMYVLMEFCMNSIYNWLDHAGVFATIFKFMGWH